MTKLVLLYLFLSATVIFSQDLNIKNNPYDKAPANVRETEAFEHERYFYEQRMYPNNFIPKDAYTKAYKQKEKLKQENGYALMGPFDTWTSLGPTTGFIGQYSNITARMPTVKYDPNNGNIIYIGAAFGGVWKSTDAGASWTAKSDNEVSLSSGAITIDPNNSNIIYYGTGEATYSTVSYYGRGILKSTNGGDNWINYTSGLPPSSYTSRIIVRPNNSSQILAAMGVDGLYRSTDSGVNWVQVVSGRCDDVVFSPTGDTAYIVGSGTGYRVSTNGGAAFTVNAALTMGTRNHIALCKSSPNVLYFSKYDGASTITVFKSINAGSTFTQIVSGQNFSASQAWYDFFMHVNPFDPNNAYVGAVDVWRTTNGGATNFVNITNAYGSGNVHPDQHNVEFHPTDINQMLCVNDGGIWKSTNKGTNWINQNTNLTLTQFYRIASDPSNSLHILGGTQDNGTQKTTGALGWADVLGSDGGEVCFHAKNNSYIIAETQNNGMRRTTNGGSVWSLATSGVSGTAAWVAPIISHPDSSGIFYTARQQVFKTVNWGASWTAISTGTSGTLREMAISKSSANVMYATSGSSIFKSTNRGYTFVSVTTGLPAGTITSVNVHPDSSQVVVITFSGFGTGHIYKTTNGGTSWNNITGNLPDSPANDAFIYYPGVATSSYYIANDVGVFVTNNFGQSWTELANGLPNTVAMHLDYHQTSGKLRVGTHGRGVFEIQLNALSVDVQAASVGVTGYQLFSSTLISPTGTVQNNANSTVTFNVTRKINPGGYVSTKTVTNLGPGASTPVIFDSWIFTPGTAYTVKDSVSLSGDLKSSNDTLSGKISPNLGQTVLKLSEGYTSGFPPSGWNIEYTGINYWSRDVTSSYGVGTGSAKFNFYDAPAGTTQSLVTPVFTSSAAGDSLVFDHAYATYQTENDQLQIQTSTNGGTSYTNLVLLNGGVSGQLVTTAPSAAIFSPSSNQWATKKYSVPAGTNKIKFTAISAFGNNLFIDSVRLESKSLFTQFNIKLIPEGFFNTVSGRLNMRDTARAYLRNTASPYTIIDSSVSIIDSLTYSAGFIFKNAASGTYYIMLKHRNTVQTWSKAGGESFTRGTILSFDFTTAAAQAFGSNMILKGTKYCVYSGDINQDGLVELSDVILVFNDASNFVTGYAATDVSGDRSVDLNDLTMTYNNSGNFVSKVTPP